MRKPPQILLTALWILGARQFLRAQIIPEAMLSFPGQTDYVEYDNLASLRKLPNYNTLRQQFAGKPLEEAKAALSRLGISEDQVHEIVSGSSATAFYGLASGTFSGQSVAVAARRKGFAVKILESEVLCPGRQACVVFLEDSLAAFGTRAELKDMLEAHQGFTARLGSNRRIVSLLNGTERQAPVRGVLFGGQLQSGVSDMLKEWTGWKRDWSQLSGNVSALGYGVKFDNQAHVSATLECTSKTAAALLVQMLGALSGFQSVAASAANSQSAPSFQNLQFSSSGDTVEFKADTTVAAIAQTGH